MAKMNPFIDVSAIAETMKKIQKCANTSPAVFERTLKDMGSRAPGKVASAVTSVYGIKKGEITPTKKNNKKLAGEISYNGETLVSFELLYSGRVLTPLHFGMTPKVRPDKKKYKVKAKIKKATKIFNPPAGGGVFLAATGHNKTSLIPWMRHSKYPLDISPIKTLSLPQMVDNETVRELMREELGDLLKKRFDNNLKQHLKKNLK